MRGLLKTLGYAVMLVSASFAVSGLAELVMTEGRNSQAVLARLYVLAVTGLAGYLLWRAGDKRGQPALRNPALHLTALLVGVMLTLLASIVLGLLLASVLSNSGQPEADPATWGLLFFFGGAALGGALAALGQYRQFAEANKQAKAFSASPGAIGSEQNGPGEMRWAKLLGWLRLTASLLLGLALFQQGIDLLQRSHTTNGMDVGASVAGVLALLILVLDAGVFLIAALALAALLRPNRVSGVLAGSLGFVVGLLGIVLGLLVAAAFRIGSMFLLPAILLFAIAYTASLVAYARSTTPARRRIES